MNSDTSYNRLVKLLQSLLQLVITEKRHMFSVCVTLQRLVFEKASWPNFKNWPEICNLGKEDRLMMLVVASLDMSATDDRTQQIISAFPECFSEVETVKRVPLSYIRNRADEKKREDRHSSGGPGYGFPESYGVIDELGFPKLEFRTDDDCVADTPELPMIPEHIKCNDQQGWVVDYEGRKFVIVENNRNSGVNIMTLVPAELVDVTV